MLQVGVIIPTLNAGNDFEKLLTSIACQQINIARRLIIDSGSADNTVQLAKHYQYEVLSVDRQTFNHGKTRQLGVDYLKNIDIAILLTQDVILQSETSISKLIAAFENEKVSAAYGRQLPHKNASPLAVQTRLFNYSKESCIKSYEDKNRLGIKTAFMSDSFAAYRIADLQAVGGFPHIIVNEDMYIAAKLLLRKRRIAYVADACVYHSHDYTLWQELKRYFDIGVFQRREAWIRQEFGEAEGEGLRLVKAQVRYLINKNLFHNIPQAMVANVVKFIGYRLGMYENHLPIKLKKVLSGQHYFFEQ